MGFIFKCILGLLVCVVLAEDYNIQHNDGSYEFGYDNPDSFHHSKANRRNFVRGEFGSRNPKTGRIDVTSYTAGPRGYRPRGKNIVRNFDQNQNRPRPIGSRDDPYFDPNEDPSYKFGFKTRTQTRQEAANSLGDVTGKYSYLDDVGERHNVEYIAGKDTGFHVKTPFPDSNPRAYGPLFFRGRGKPIPRGRTAIQRGLDGSYRFVSAGPDQRRTETSDASGNVRGSYTYLDDKGVQHSVHYIAGPQIGYRVLKNVKGPHLPSVFPFSSPDIIPADFYNYLDEHANGDVFDTAASSRPRPDDIFGDGGYDSAAGASGRPKPKPGKPGFGDEDDGYDSDDLFGGGGASSTSKPASVSTTTLRPSDGDYDDGAYKPGGSGSAGGDDDDEDDDLFGDFGPKPSGGRPSSGGSSRPSSGGSSRPSAGGSSRPSAGGSSRPSAGGSSRPSSGGSSRPSSGGSSRPSSGGSSRPSSGGSSRPSTGGSRPSSGSRPSTPGRPSDGGYGSTTGGGVTGTGGSASRPSGAGFGTSGGGSSRPSTGGSSRPSGGFRPSTYDDEDDDDFSLFGNPSPTSSPKPPVISIGVTSSGGGGNAATKPDKQHTIVTNLGSTVFTVPPGVSVHAHVQSIDLFPYESKVPSPSEQFNSETRNVEQSAEASENHALTTTPIPPTTTANTST